MKIVKELVFLVSSHFGAQLEWGLRDPCPKELCPNLLFKKHLFLNVCVKSNTSAEFSIDTSLTVEVYSSKSVYFLNLYCSLHMLMVRLIFFSRGTSLPSFTFFE